MSCEHGNWPPCDQCDAADAAIEEAYKRGYIAGGIAALSPAAQRVCRECGAEYPDGLRCEKCEPAAQQVDGWQAIESAPKDGRMFLGWVAAERWSSEDGGGSGRSADTSDVDFCQWCDNGGNGYFANMMGQIGDAQDITHWMPLPEPPAANAAQDVQS